MGILLEARFDWWCQNTLGWRVRKSVRCAFLGLSLALGASLVADDLKVKVSVQIFTAPAKWKSVKTRK